MKKNKILSAHQPDLFPYSGLFSKMSKSEYFDIAEYDQYTKGRFMDRVKIGRVDQLVWLNLSIVRDRIPINEIHVKSQWKGLLLRQIERQYKNKNYFPFYDKRKHLVEEVLSLEGSQTLATVGKKSIEVCSKFLEIDTKIDVLGDNLPLGYNGIIELANRYSKKYNTNICYLSGMGGKAYLDEEEFKKHHCLIYNDYSTSYNCSILTPLFELENPKIVL